MRHLLLFALFTLFLTGTTVRLNSVLKEVRIEAPASAEVLYLPKGRGLELMSLGYRNMLAHLMWFNTVSYFGKHYRGDRDYVWLAHMCSLVTRLNPRLTDVFQFCGTMLAWEGNRPQEGVEILGKAIEHNPADWIFYYLRGFISAFFLKDEAAAKQDFSAASRLPGVPALVVRLASKKILDLESPQEAISFLNEALEQAQGNEMRRVLADRLQEAYFELGFRELEQALRRYREQKSGEPEIIEDLAEFFPAPSFVKHNKYLDPYGGRYYYDASSRSIRSSTTRKRESLHWKR